MPCSFVAAYPEYVARVLTDRGIDVPLLGGRRRVPLDRDRYGLSPSSSKQLGPDAYEVHPRWGTWRAQAHGVRPRAGLLCVEADAPNLVEQLDALGYEVQKLPSMEELVLGVVDISVPGADRVIADMAGAGTRVVAFGADPDDMAQIRTKALGASVVVSRSELLDDLAEHVPRIV